MNITLLITVLLMTASVYGGERAYIQKFNEGIAIIRANENDLREEHYSKALTYFVDSIAYNGNYVINYDSYLCEAICIRSLGKPQAYKDKLKVIASKIPEGEVEKLSRIYKMLCAVSDKPEQLEYLSRMLNLSSDNAAYANGIAWRYAVQIGDGGVDAKMALQIAEMVDKQVKSVNYHYMDTMAAALAVNGEYEKAVKLQTDVVLNCEINDVKGARQRLDLYRRREAFRDNTYPIDRPIPYNPFEEVKSGLTNR